MSKKKDGGATTAELVLPDGGQAPEQAANGHKPKLSPRQRFCKYVARRLDDVEASMRRLGNLGNRSSYAYSPAEEQQILDRVDSAVKAMRARFREVTSKPERGLFRFDEGSRDGQLGGESWEELQ